MTYISSQHYIDPKIVEAKKAELVDVFEVVIPCTYVGVIDGVEYAMQNDKHHTLAAAKELGIPVVFDISDDAEGLAGEELLEARYNDGDYYNVETSNPIDEQFDLIW